MILRDYVLVCLEISLAKTVNSWRFNSVACHSFAKSPVLCVRIEYREILFKQLLIDECHVRGGRDKISREISIGISPA